MTHSDDNGLVCPPKLCTGAGGDRTDLEVGGGEGSGVRVGHKVKDDLARDGIRRAARRAGQPQTRREVLRVGSEGRAVAASKSARATWRRGRVMTARRTGGKTPAKLDGIGGVVRKSLDEIQAALVQAAKDRREAHSIRGVTKQTVSRLHESHGWSPTAASAGRPHAKPRSSNRRGRPCGCSPIRNSARPRRPRRVCGAGSPAWRRRCGRRRTRVRSRAAPFHRGAGRHPRLRLQRQPDPRPVPRAARRPERRAAPHLLFREGQRQYRRPQGAQGVGAGADIVSVGELRRALAAGFEASSIVFSGVGKTAPELEEAIRAGVGFLNVESPPSWTP